MKVETIENEKIQSESLESSKEQPEQENESKVIREINNHRRSYCREFSSGNSTDKGIFKDIWRNAN